MLCFFVALNQSDFAFGVGHVPIGVVTVGSAFLFLAFGVRVPKKWKERWDKAPLQTPLISPPEKSQEGGNSSLAICTAVLAVFAVASLRIQNQAEIPTLSHHNDVMPEINLANWKAVETPLDATTYDIVGTKDAHMFRYDGAGKPVYLYWLHSENSRKIGHPPELCYRGDSYEIVERDEKTVNVNGREIPIIRMVVQRGDYRLLVYYWYRIGGVETASYLEHQIKWAWQHLNSSNENNEASMTRISTEIDGGAEDRLKQWMREALTKGA
jgi:EpsI family protein